MNAALDARQLLDEQQAAFHAEAGADARVRRERLERAIALLVGLRPPYGRRAERVLKWLIRP
jgi:hypothetical protein